MEETQPVSEKPSTSISFDQQIQVEKQNKIIGEKGHSCVSKFDALWFCYSPVYQMREYYIYGTVDDCSGHWKAFYDCLKHKTRFKEEAKAPEGTTHPLWQLRTVSEAEEFWQQQFDSKAAPSPLI